MLKSSYRTPDGNAQIDWELRNRNGKGLEFSATGDYERGGGQCLDEIGKRYPEDPIVTRLVTLWELYHLNGMQAGTPAQRALGWGQGFDVALSVNTMTEPQKIALLKRNEGKVRRQREEWVKLKRERFLTKVQDRKAFWGAVRPDRPFTDYVDAQILLVTRQDKLERWPKVDPLLKLTPKRVNDWLANSAELEFPTPPVESEVFKDSIGAPCPETGYFYGSKRLFEPIPEEVIAELTAFAAQYPELDSLSEAKGKAFVAKHGIIMEAEYAPKNPNMEDGQGMTHWHCTFHRSGERMQTYFSMGSGHNGRKPTAEEVLSCLGRDASGADQSYEHWCGDFGYDTDSRKAERTYEVIKEQASQLKRLLQDEAFAELLANPWN